MARSPSPMERPKRALTKRVRVDGSKPSSQGASGKPATESADSVDVGMLLGTTFPRTLTAVLTCLWLGNVSIIAPCISPDHPHLSHLKTSWLEEHNITPYTPPYRRCRHPSHQRRRKEDTRCPSLLSTFSTLYWVWFRFWRLSAKSNRYLLWLCTPKLLLAIGPF